MTSNSKSRYFSYAILLEESTKNSTRIEERNPNAKPGMPCIYVATSRFKPPSSKKMLRNSFKLGLIKKSAVEILTNSTYEYSFHEDALMRQEQLVHEHRLSGWFVANVDPVSSYSTYVIELDLPAIKPDSRHIGALYVGQTGIAPLARFQQHKTGIHSNSKVQQFGRKLRMDLADSTYPMTRQESLRKERLLAERFRNDGFLVFGGH
jgi:hypothetical protein